MVQVSNQIPLDDDGQVDANLFLPVLSRRFPSNAFEKIKACFDLAQQHGHDIQSAFFEDAAQFGVEMAAILYELNTDYQTIAAAMLFGLYSEKAVDHPKLKTLFGSEIAHIVRDAEAMHVGENLKRQKTAEAEQAQIDRLRRMLLAMINDVRVVLVKLAERLCVMRHRKYLSPKRRQMVAHEVMSIYAPLANRLGIGQIKWEMEDLTFQVLQPKAYKAITHSLNERRLDREKYMADMMSALQRMLDELGIRADISGRVKHIYSIWRKMTRKQQRFDQLYDIRAMRVLVPNIADCYQILSSITNTWHTVPEEFDDYIATPKANGYRSIHAVILGPQDKPIEIQIRTFAMHEESEMGVAAHWRYKEGSARDASFENRINWLRNLLEWQKELAGDDERIESLRSKVMDDRVYVFTPQGAVIDLPKGSTPIDFAYHVHTEVGHRCRGAKINDKMVPLITQVETGDRVEIITGKESKPSRDWLQAEPCYIYSARARSKLQHWFRQLNKAEKTANGKAILIKAFTKAELKQVDFEQLAKHFNVHDADDLYAAIATGDVRLQQAATQARELFCHGTLEVKTVDEPQIAIRKKPQKKHSDVVIHGVDNLLSHSAGCCKPVIGDAVVGYITQGRGISVHRQDCVNMQNLSTACQARLVPVEWSGSAQSNAVDIKVKVHDQVGVLKDVTTLLANEKVAVLGLQTHINKRDGGGVFDLTLEVNNLDQVARLKDLIAQLPTVEAVWRA